MLTIILNAAIIACCRICDVTFGTIRTIMVVQGKKYYAALAGFCEVLIWISAMSFIVNKLNNPINLVAYAFGFAMGNLIGITVEQKIGFGYIQINVISKFHTEDIAQYLRKSRHGVTILPGEGTQGGISIILVIAKRKYQKEILKSIENIDKKAFITIQSSLPYRGFIHGARK